MNLRAAKVGERIKFAEERHSYTIKARSSRYLICTKPFNAKETVLYTIVDLQEKIRGPENLIFGLGQETVEQCEDTLRRLEDVREPPTEVSHRHRIPLVVDWVRKSK